ncbi:MAG TPA: metalloregulator ArsR/SmtB family transcription factor [Spirochaetota bacterium]|nr:metalloregulator ArsR/SmtB family transcription factor [Spirochaetota bacterium]
MEDYILKLKCLSDETRIRILKIIIEGNQELCVCEIVDALQIPFYTISKHIKELKNAKILSETKDGKFVMYSLIKEKDDFLEKIINLINSIPNKIFKNDLDLLRKRLSLRDNGKCVVGMKN